jgi:spermidine synthase
VIVGDARLSLEREVREGEGRVYDVLAVDAFSGDAIPVHLLTREAFALYAEALREDGVLAVHVTNHFLDLKAVVRGLAREAGRQVVEIETDDDFLRGLDGNTWMLVTSNAEMVAAASAVATPDSPDAKVVVWTDSFSSLLQVLKH